MSKIAAIIDKFDANIVLIEKSNYPQLTELNLKIKLTEDCLNELRQEVKLNGFDLTKDEIHFFKKQKPYIKGRLKFYIGLNAYLIEKPVGSKSEQRKYVDLQLSYIRLDNCKYIDFVNYYKLNETKNDKFYFLRGVDQLELFIDKTTIFEDPEFRTIRDHLASKIVANDLLTQYFTNELELLKKKNTKPLIQEVQSNKSQNVIWTGSNIGLFELFLSLKENKSLNHGNISIKELKNFTESLFNQKFGNFYKSYQEIKSRKNNNTKFLDNLKESLQNKIDSDDNL